MRNQIDRWQGDSSNLFIKIDVEMLRLGWTVEQGRNYLFQTYGKKSRHVLSQEELLEFLHYLESQSIPPNSYAMSRGDITNNFYEEVEDEIKRLCLSEEEQQEYLFQTYGKESLKLLTQEELDKLIIYLKSQPSAVINTLKYDEQYSYFRDLLNDTSLKMLYLDWTNEQRRHYLVKTYGTKSLYSLTEIELLDFHRYLNSITPPNP
jgi:hypothetical protein